MKPRKNRKRNEPRQILEQCHNYTLVANKYVVKFSSIFASKLNFELENVEQSAFPSARVCFSSDHSVSESKHFGSRIIILPEYARYYNG